MSSGERQSPSAIGPVGERLGPYVLEGILGRGGMGIVYRAIDPAGRAVAIKRLSLRDPEVTQRLAREADVRVVHPNVVRVLASGVDRDGEPYVVTELLVGRSLDQVLREPQDVARLVGLFAQAAEGLAAIHAAGIVHRDVKPSNLFVTTDGTLKILDFGVATFAGTVTRLTSTGAMIGTPAYFSPEQARGAPVDARSDIWGLGMTLYEALAGQLPFRRESVVACAFAVQNDALPSLFDVGERPSFSLELVGIVERCLAKKREDRFASAAELARALRTVRAEGEGRPSQPILTPTSETWRTVALVLVDGTVSAEIQKSAEAGGAEVFSILASASAIVFGRSAARGDELDRALRFASSLRSVPVAVGAARARSLGAEIDETSLASLAALLDRARLSSGRVWITPELAALVADTHTIERDTDGAAFLASATPSIPPPAELVGRDAELTALHEAADRARAGAVVRVGLVGEAGMGKTALLRAFLDRMDPAVIARVGHGVPGSTAPYATLFDAYDIEETDDGEGTAALAVDKRRARILDHLGEDLVRADLVVLVVEDARDADDATRALLDEIERDLGERALLVIETSREKLPGRSTIVLGPLGSAAIGRIALAIVGAAMARSIAEPLTARSGGNPGFAVELARLAKARGEDAEVARWELPATVESAIQAQLDGLSDELRSATHTLAVLGADTSLEEARWALGTRADGWIHALALAGLIAVSQKQGRMRVRFESRAVAEVAYAALDPETAARTHRSIAARLATSTSVSPERVLHHAERGGDTILEARFVELSLARAAHAGDGPRVLDLLARMRANGSPTFEALFAAAEAAPFVAGAPSPESLLDEARLAARTPAQRAACLVELGERARRAGRIEEARRLLEEAIAIDPVSTDAARATSRLALVRLSEGDADAARALLDACSLDGVTASAAAWVWDTRGYVHGARGELGARREAYERAAALYAESGDLRREAGASANLGDTLREIGDLRAAEPALRRAIEAARRVGNVLTEAYATANLGATLLALGRTREGIAATELAATRAEAVQDVRLGCVIALRLLRTGRALSEVERARLDTIGDATLRALELLARLEQSPTSAELDEAAALLAQGEAIEEGALELAAAYARHRPSEQARALAEARVQRTYATLTTDAMRERFVTHVAAVAPDLLGAWIRSVRA